MTYRVRCTGYNAHEKNFTIGKVYEVKDNCITADDGFVYHGNNHDNGTIVEWLATWYAFERVTDQVKLKNGDRVRIRKDLKGGERYNNVTCTSEMASHAGEIVTIDRVDFELDGAVAFTIREKLTGCMRGWLWSSGMVEPLYPDHGEPTAVSKFVNPPTLTAKERVMCAIASSGYPYAVKSDSGLLFYSDLPNGVSVFKTSDVKGW